MTKSLIHNKSNEVIPHTYGFWEGIVLNKMSKGKRELSDNFIHM